METEILVQEKHTEMKTNISNHVLWTRASRGLMSVTNPDVVGNFLKDEVTSN